jgi:hypothetical protein
MAPLFVSEIERYLSSSSRNRPSTGALFFMFHLLGSWRETQAYPVLTRLLHRPEEEVEGILGDGTTETCHRVIAAVFNGDPQPIYDIVLDPKACEYVRSSVCEALAMLVWENRLERTEVARFLRDSFMHLRPQAECSV